MIAGVISDGDITVAAGTKLYILDHGVLDILQGHTLTVNGTLQILALPEAPATLTSHAAAGATLPPGDGFFLRLTDCDNYNPADGSGTVLQDATIESVQANNYQPIVISGCKPLFYNLKITSVQALIYLESTSGLTMQRCSLSGISPFVMGDQRGTGVQIDHNIIDGGAGNYSIAFLDPDAGLPVADGQIVDNVFYPAVGPSVWCDTATGTVPLGNNYWTQGAPTTYNDRDPQGQHVSPCLLDFSPALSSAPANAGPTW